MKLDETNTKIINIIKKEVKEVFNKDLTIEEIYNVILSQIEATKEGIKRGFTIHWIHFGKFVFTNKRKRKFEVEKNIEYLKEYTDLNQIDILQIKKNLILESANDKKKYIKQGNPNAGLKIEDVKKTKEIESAKFIFNINNRKKT